MMPTLPLPINNTLSNINYLIFCSQTRDCCVIDPLDTSAILQTAHDNNLRITHIINTHEHHDHTEGNISLKKETHARIMAYHNAIAIIPGFDHGLKDQDKVSIGNSITLNVYYTPGHTEHSICLHDQTNHALYTGDTLFNCGCGNCRHGGNVEDLFNTFENILQHLPNQTMLYPGHDYLVNNMRFAESVGVDSEKLKHAQNRLITGQLTLTTLGEDKEINPFFQVDNPNVKLSLGLDKSADRKTVFYSLRERRNSW
jgi:hydroxyacylglutathione hydrolase